MRIADENDLFGDSWLVYDFIARNFIGSLSQNLKYMSTHVVLQIGGEKFECKGKCLGKREGKRHYPINHLVIPIYIGSQVVSPGFTSVMHW
jgi:DNA topoisomerase-3